MTLRVGVAGAGVMGTDHATILHSFVSGAEVEVVTDPDPERTARLRDQIPSVRVGADAAELVADPSVDAVIVASPDSTHAELVLACLEAGKPVLCEKPLATSVAEAEQVVAAERSAVGQGGQRLVSVGFMRRFDAGYVALKSAVERAELGAPLLAHAVCRTVTSGPGTSTESVVVNSAIHDLDSLPWLLGSPVVAAAWHAGRPSSAVDGFADPQLILLRTASGVLCTVEVFLNARYGYDMRCEVVCESGALALAEPVHVRRDADQLSATGYAPDWRPRFADAYRLELQAWVDAVRRGQPSPLALAEDGLRASRVAETVIAAMATEGRFVPVTGVDP